MSAHRFFVGMALFLAQVTSVFSYPTALRMIPILPASVDPQTLKIAQSWEFHIPHQTPFPNKISFQSETLLDGMSLDASTGKITFTPGVEDVGVSVIDVDVSQFGYRRTIKVPVIVLELGHEDTIIRSETSLSLDNLGLKFIPFSHDDELKNILRELLFNLPNPQIQFVPVNFPSFLSLNQGATSLSISEVGEVPPGIYQVEIHVMSGDALLGVTSLNISIHTPEAPFKNTSAQCSISGYWRSTSP